MRISPFELGFDDGSSLGNENASFHPNINGNGFVVGTIVVFKIFRIGMPRQCPNMIERFLWRVGNLKSKVNVSGLYRELSYRRAYAYAYNKNWNCLTCTI